MASLTADPPASQVPAAGGTATHQLTNAGAARLAFKVKSSNNNEYRLKPVFGFIEPGAAAPLEITRLVSSHCLGMPIYQRCLGRTAEGRQAGGAVRGGRRRCHRSAGSVQGRPRRWRGRDPDQGRIDHIRGYII